MTARQRTIDLPYPPPFMTAEVLARHLCVEPQTVDLWTNEGILPRPIKPKNVRLWVWSKVVAALDRGIETVQDATGVEDPAVMRAKRAAEKRQRNG